MEKWDENGENGRWRQRRFNGGSDQTLFGYLPLLYKENINNKISKNFSKKNPFDAKNWER